MLIYFLIFKELTIIFIVMRDSDNQLQFQKTWELITLFLVISFVVFFVFAIVDVLDIVKSGAYSNIASSLNFN